MYWVGIITARTRSVPRASQAIASVSAESTPPDKPQQRARKSVLAQVVARADDQRRVDLGLERQFLRYGARNRRGAVEFDQLERLLEERRLPHHVALRIEHAGSAIEHELVLPADQVYVHHRQARRADPFAKNLVARRLFPLVIRRGVDRQDHLGPGRLGHRRRLGPPYVLADREAETHALDLEDAGLVPRGEVALLVEHFVVRQVVLARDGHDAAVADHRRGVIALAVVRELRETHHRGDAVDLRRKGIEFPAAVAVEPFAQEQVFGRIAAQRKFRRQHEVRALVAGPACVVEDTGGVALQVAHRAVDLCEGEHDASVVHSSRACLWRHECEYTANTALARVRRHPE